MQIASPKMCFNLEHNNLHVCYDAKATTAVLLGMSLVEEHQSHRAFKHMFISVEIIGLLTHVYLIKTDLNKLFINRTVFPPTDT
jgi:hypothetical protein